jgi:N-acetylmuramoyl-L-alanine amidase
LIVHADSSLVAEVRPSPNFEPRRGGRAPALLLLHYTGTPSCRTALDWLANPQSRVSCHYVVDEDGCIIQMVPESMRAWHAGLSCWAGETDINSASIGIEIHNPGHEAGYPDFPPAQMKAVEALSRDLISRYGIRPQDVLAHSDVAPVRKKDPGEKFDWRRLAEAGIGHWIEPTAPDRDEPGLGPGATGEGVAEAQHLLALYGYALEPSGIYDRLTEFVVTAFQRHFRPARVDGRLDRSTLRTLERLIAALPASPGPG